MVRGFTGMGDPVTHDINMRKEGILLIQSDEEGQYALLIHRLRRTWMHHLPPRPRPYPDWGDRIHHRSRGLYHVHPCARST